MSDQFSMFDLPTWQDTHSATFSRVSPAGPTPCASPDGPRTDPAGPDRLPVSLSASPGKVYPATIPATLHRILFGWSGPAAPECCLANRSQARMSSERLQAALESALADRLHGLGSTIYAIVWKPHVTPSGRAISRLRASARRTSDSEPSSGLSPLSGWITSQAGGNSETAASAEKELSRVHAGGVPSLTVQCHLAGWTTSAASDGERGGTGITAGMTGSSLPQQAQIAGWSTASARDWKDTAGMATEATNPDGSTRTRLDQLPRQAQLAGWPTSTSTDAVRAPGMEFTTPNITLNHMALMAAWGTTEGPARFTASGQMLTGCSAGMTNGGQLNPAFSAWLMGFPPSWCVAALLCPLPHRSRPRKKASTGTPPAPGA